MIFAHWCNEWDKVTFKVIKNIISFFTKTFILMKYFKTKVIFIKINLGFFIVFVKIDLRCDLFCNNGISSIESWASLKSLLMILVLVYWWTKLYKYNNLQYNMQVNGPNHSSTNCLMCQELFLFHNFFVSIYFFIIKIKSFECPKPTRNYERNNASNTRHFVDESFVPLTQQPSVL